MQEIKPMETIKPLCWINGEIVAAQNASISLFDHGLLYGDGIFEGIRIYQNKAFLLSEHLLRLQQSADAIQLTMPYSIEELADHVQNLVSQWPAPTGYIRLVVTRGVGTLGIDPRRCETPACFMIIDQMQMMPKEKISKGIEVIISQTRRTPANSLDPKIKTLNYLNNIMAKLEANNAGVDEAILLNQAGRLAEATGENVFVVKNNCIFTPPPEEGALNGITRNLILELATKIGIETVVKPIELNQLMDADEIFLTGTGAELIPVRELNEQPIKACPGPVYAKLQRGFKLYVSETPNT